MWAHCPISRPPFPFSVLSPVHASMLVKGHNPILQVSFQCIKSCLAPRLARFNTGHNHNAAVLCLCQYWHPTLALLHVGWNALPGHLQQFWPQPCGHSGVFAWFWLFVQYTVPGRGGRLPGRHSRLSGRYNVFWWCSSCQFYCFSSWSLPHPFLPHSWWLN